MTASRRRSRMRRPIRRRPSRPFRLPPLPRSVETHSRRFPHFLCPPFRTKLVSGRHAPMVQRTLESLEQTLKHRFRDRALLERAVTHSSLAFEQGLQGAHDNEKLEFLGDAVLGLVVAQSLYESFPDLEEGDLTRLRAALVSRRHLGNVAESLHLGDHLRLGRGEERNGGRRKTVLLANSFEAVIA